MNSAFKVQLDAEPARSDLTDREAAKLFGSLIGGLIQMAGMNNVRRAVRWWAQQDDDVWRVLERVASRAGDQADAEFSECGRGSAS